MPSFKDDYFFSVIFIQILAWMDIVFIIKFEVIIIYSIPNVFDLQRTSNRCFSMLKVTEKQPNAVWS